MATTAASPAAAPAPATAAAPAAAVNASYASASLYIGDIHPDVTEALLFEIFNAVGPVASVRVCRDAATRRSLGYAYCNFHRVEDAERALDTMNFKSIRGKPCRIMWSHRDPSLRKSGLGNIFVKNLDKSIDNKTLYDTFSMFGNILSCKVATDQKGESLGYGFVHYESDDSATNAIQRVNGKIIAGQKVIVAPFKPKRERGSTNSGTFTNVYVKNIPEDASQEDLDQLFKKHGTVTSSMIASDESGKFKGFGFVNYEDAEQAFAAVESLNGHEITTASGSKKLVVCRAQKKDERAKELRDKFEKIKQERQKKYEGVNLYVKNLSDQIDDEKLREEFKQFGTITSVKVMNDSNQKTKGFGFVCFSTPEEATKALTEMNGRMLDSKPLYVALAQRKDVRRTQLEAQYQNRSKVGVAPPQMYPPQGQPMFYSPGMPPRNFIYPQQMIPRRWPNGPGGPPQMMVMGGRPAGYQLMPVNGRNPQIQGGAQISRGPNGNMNRARRSAGGIAQGQQGQGKGGPRRVAGQQGVRYTENVRNQNRADQQAADDVAGAEPSPVVPDAAGIDTEAPLTISMLASAPEEQKKQMIGERLFPLIKAIEPQLAGKITGMLLEMDNGELIHLIESKEALLEKVNEAITVLNEHSG